jgi:predicted secreted protein
MKNKFYIAPVLAVIFSTGLSATQVHPTLPSHSSPTAKVSLQSKKIVSPPKVEHVLLNSSSKTVKVSLNSNRTTGFRWFLTSKPGWVEVVGSVYIPKKVPAGFVGSGGQSVWSLRADNIQGARYGTICWRYMQSWSPSSGSDLCKKVFFAPQ